MQAQGIGFFPLFYLFFVLLVKKKGVFKRCQIVIDFLDVVYAFPRATSERKGGNAINSSKSSLPMQRYFGKGEWLRKGLPTP
ncbi:MAG TPA: hypothetical protein ENO02_03370, partial [Epsilonproteobacteria bacterium]|nr:hypothetical protein [Campylobacterota bacterium]